ncbi:hypothetical protein, partial [Chitinophaga tropicalis]
MILQFAARRKKTFASLMLALLYFEVIIPSYAIANVPSGTLPRRDTIQVAEKLPVPATVKSVRKISKAPFIGGPGQPESQAFHSVNNENMVDLFSGDFSYSIPLIDVDGYPLAIGYNSGISMEQEASWVGLGWNINPGAITRNMRGLPDDFDGNDTIQKIASVKENKTVGGTIGLGMEVFGLPNSKKDTTTKVGFGASLGISYNTYKGIGLETGLNASINAGAKGMGTFTSALSFTNSSRDGITVGSSLAYGMSREIVKENNIGGAASVSVGSALNTRAGMKDLTFSLGTRQYKTAEVNKRTVSKGWGSSFSSGISFAYPSFTPNITLPYTSSFISFVAKVGSETKGL